MPGSMPGSRQWAKLLLVGTAEGVRREAEAETEVEAGVVVSATLRLFMYTAA